jgi:hypothetical protein
MNKFILILIAMILTPMAVAAELPMTILKIDTHSLVVIGNNTIRIEEFNLTRYIEACKLALLQEDRLKESAKPGSFSENYPSYPVDALPEFTDNGVGSSPPLP